MPKRNSKGHFVKTTHRRRARRASASTTAIVVAAPRAPARRRRTHRVHHVAHRRRRSSRSSGQGMKLLHLAGAAIGLAYLTGDQSPVQAIPQNVAKLPGAKTLGNTTVAGLACLAVDRYVHKNRWLRLAGVAGVVAGALQVGAKGTDFKWVGDEGDEYTGDVIDDLNG